MILRFLYISLLVFIPQLSSASDVSLIVDKFILKQEEIMQGYEYKESRNVILADVVGGEDKDLLAFYTMESMQGSNNYVRFLTVFEKRSGKYVYTDHEFIGGKWSRLAKFREVKNRKIILNATYYAKDDPACCPSIQSTTTYIVSGGQIAEIQEP